MQALLCHLPFQSQNNPLKILSLRKAAQLSGAVVAVYLYVVVSEVATPGRRAVCSHFEVNIDFNLVAGENLLCKVLVKEHAAAVFAYGKCSLYRAEFHVYLIHVNRLAGIAYGTEHPAPVGIRTEHCRLYKG